MRALRFCAPVRTLASALVLALAAAAHPAPASAATTTVSLTSVAGDWAPGGTSAPPESKTPVDTVPTGITHAPVAPPAGTTTLTGTTTLAGATSPAKGTVPLEAFILGNILPVGAVNDQFTHGFSQQLSAGVSVGTDFPLLGQRILLDWQYYDIGYRHPSGYVDNIGGGSAYVPSFVNHLYTLEERAAVQIPKVPVPIYAGFAVYYHPNRAGLPVLVSPGLGLEKPLETRKKQSLFGRLYYYPNVNSERDYRAPDGTGYQERFTMFRYEIGYARQLPKIGKVHGLVTFGLTGDLATAVVNAPSDFNTTSVQVGLGFGI